MPTTTKGITLRLLGRSDATHLTALSGRFGAEPLADWQARFARADSLVVGAEIDGRLVGYAGGEVRRSFGRSAPTAWVDAFGVDLDQRGHGVGRALAVALLGRLRVRGADHVFTLVPLHDRALDPFFRDLGFRDEPVVCLGRAL